MSKTLAERMKAYENVNRTSLPGKSMVLARIDGRSFKNYTKRFKEPFDEEFIEDMDKVAAMLAKEVSGCKFAYVQSDEISLFINEETIESQPWFEYNVQKMSSCAASFATAEFNRLRMIRKADEMHFSCLDITNMKLANFDARFWTVPTPAEALNYFVWRQRDAIKNSISAVAQAHFSPKLLENKNGDEKINMLLQQKMVNYFDFPIGQRQGRLIMKFSETVKEGVNRSRFKAIPAEEFSKNPEILMSMIRNPNY